MSKFLSFLFLSIQLLNAQIDASKVQIDSLNSLLNKSRDSNSSYEHRLEFAKEAVAFSQIIEIDSLILKSELNLSYAYLNIDDYELFKKYSHKNLKLAEKLNDTLSLAKANNNLGWYHHVNLQNDSAYYYYYNAVRHYSELGLKRNEGEVLLNMGNIQQSVRDYVGSEANAIRAIKLIQDLPETENNLDTLWSLHNLIGLISIELGLFDKSLEYHQKALSFSSKMTDEYIYNLYSTVNIALVYTEMKSYDKAINLYEELLDDNRLFNSQKDIYAFVLNNLAYVKFLNKSDSDSELKPLFSKAIAISDSLSDEERIMAISNNYAEYLQSLNNKDSAFYYAHKAYKLGKETFTYEIVLDALELMSELKEGSQSTNYLKERIKLSDSLVNNERQFRNKFARIEFETDQLKVEKEKADRERLIFLASTVGLLITLILIYVIISQRIKNRELAFEKQQQEANAEIYNLMLAQQDKIEEGRTAEKKRISEELHDGILSRLFGTRFSLDSLNFQSGDEAVKKRGQYISELQAIEQEIRKISHDLNADFVSGSSFTDILKTLVETQTTAYQLKYTLHQDEAIDWDDVDNKTKIHVYRMLQETMQNVYKHAQAKSIKISFQLKNDVILLTVEDDGIGFNTNKARKGIGLKNFHSRAQEIGGKVEIFSNPNQGTKVKIHIPTAN